MKKAVPFLLLPVMTAYLTPSDYAQLSIFVLVINLVVMLSGVGMTKSIILEYQNQDEAGFRRYLLTCFVLLGLCSAAIASLCFTLQNPILHLFKIPPEWLWAVFVIALGTNLTMMMASFFQAQHRPVSFVVIVFTFMAVEILISLYLIVGLNLHWQGRLVGMVIASNIAALIVALYLLRYRIAFQPFDGAAAKRALQFGLPIIPYSLGLMLMNMSDRLLLDHMVDRHALGQYAVGFQLAMVVVLIAQTMELALAPWLYKQLKQGDDAQRGLITKGFWASFLGFPIFGLFFGLSSWFVFQFLINDAFSDGFPVAVILSVAYGFGGVQLLLSLFITYQRKTLWLSALAVFAGVVNIVVSYILILNMGMIGAAWGSLIANMIGMIVTWLMAMRICPMPWFGAPSSPAPKSPLCNRALIMTRTDINRNAGTQRLADWMLDLGYDLDVVSSAQILDAQYQSKVNLIPLAGQAVAQKNAVQKAMIALNLFLLRDKSHFIWNKGTKQVFHKLANTQYDVVIVNDIYLGPVARRIANHIGARLVFDAREYYPRQYEHSWLWRVFIRPVRQSLCRQFIATADLVTTVSPGLAQAYADEFDIQKPLVIESMAAKYEMALQARNDPQIRLLYHGAATPQRGLHDMITMMDHLGTDFSLDMVLINQQYFPSYAERLQDMADSRDHVRIVDAVTPDQIIAFSAQYDVALITYPPNSYNIKHCLPNKFFESIQARMAIIVGETPDMAEYVQHYGLGVVAQGSNAEDWADAVRQLTRDTVEHYRHNADKAAQDLHSDIAGLRFKQAITQLLKGQGAS